MDFTKNEAGKQITLKDYLPAKPSSITNATMFPKWINTIIGDTLKMISNS